MSMAPLALAALSALSCSTADRETLISLLLASAAAQGRPEIARALDVEFPDPDDVLRRIGALDARCGRS